MGIWKQIHEFHSTIILEIPKFHIFPKVSHNAWKTSIVKVLLKQYLSPTGPNK